MLAVLPVAVLVGSPQRVALSALIAAAYVGVALVTVREAGRGRAVNRILIAYVALAAAWMVLAWLRSRFLLHLQPEQLDYASSKAAYFVLVVLPMAAAVAMMVDRAEAIWPTALSQVAIGGAVAVLTVALLGDRILGEERYSWQGNLIALGTVLAIQPWPIQKFKASVVIGVLGVAGIMLADSRQSVVATIVAMFASAVYWTASRYIAERGTRWSRLRFAISGRYVVLPLVLILLTCAYIGVTYAGAVGAHLSLPGVSVNSQPSSCHCVTDRIVSIQGNAGDRDKLLARGVHMFLSNPMFGAGLGSFAGAVPDSILAGHFYPYPHNVPLEIASETGLLGVLVLLGPLLAGWAALFWAGVKQASAPIAIVLMFVAVFFTVANVSGDIPSDRALWIFGIVALRLAFRTADATGAESPRPVRAVGSNEAK